ncbi:hypothetical protein GGR56DRAFT_649721 [Xylariaceae sp. FL0804]|nr:hypothetical protein GGR56DRAFT_649721 [Xylariaceae sp. FL0804]
MAEPYDIDYLAIGAGQHIASRSKRCSLDHSSHDSSISLSDDSDRQYLSPAIAAIQPSGSSWASKTGLDSQDTSNGHAILTYEVLSRMETRPASPGSSIHPLVRYSRDTETHEQLALGTPCRSGSAAEQGNAANADIKAASGPVSKEVTDMLDSNHPHDVLSDEETQRMLKSTLLKRRIQSDGNPRRTKAVRTRKRISDRSGEKDGQIAST